MLKIGFQYTPVDSMATCVTPLEQSQSAISTNSRVVVPQWRTSCSTLPTPLIRRMQASTLSLCTSKPAQHLRMTSHTFLLRPSARGHRQYCSVCPACLCSATILATRRCPGQTAVRATTAPQILVLHPRRSPPLFSSSWVAPPDMYDCGCFCNYWHGPLPQPLEGVEVDTGGVPCQ